jgi:hypothetical protein
VSDVKILIDSADGRYSTRPLTEEEATRLEAQGHDVAHVADDVWAEYQGCCCGHDHEKLDEATAQQLRHNGFVVDHDSEIPEEEDT